MIDKKLTDLYKSIIEINNAIKSGNLYNSIYISNKIINNVLIINISGVNYLNDVDKRLFLTQQFLNNNIVIELIGELIVQPFNILTKIEDLSKIKTVNDIKIYINKKEFI